jgi:hypothetical protein
MKSTMPKVRSMLRNDCLCDTPVTKWNTCGRQVESDPTLTRRRIDSRYAVRTKPLARRTLRVGERVD